MIPTVTVELTKAELDWIDKGLFVIHCTLKLGTEDDKLITLLRDKLKMIRP
jgi:hypothetical protein